MDEFDIFKLFFKTNKDYSTTKSNQFNTDYEDLRADEVIEKNTFEDNEVAQCDDINSFIGGICLLLTKQPYVGKSGGNAILCGTGLEQKKDNRCPLCRSEEEFFCSLDQANLQDQSIILKCKYTDGDYEVKISNFTEHLKTCGHAPYRCLEYPNCKVIIKRKDVHNHKMHGAFTKVRGRHYHSHILYRQDLKDHENNLCDFKPIPCQGCKVHYYKNAIKNHEAECSEYPIKCCQCLEFVPRKKLDDHDLECPKIKVSCVAFDHGSFQTTRDHIEQHEIECAFVYGVQKKTIEELTKNLNIKNYLIKQLTEKLEEDKDTFKFSFKKLFS